MQAAKSDGGESIVKENSSEEFGQDGEETDSLMVVMHIIVNISLPEQKDNSMSPVIWKFFHHPY